MKLLKKSKNQKNNKMNKIKEVLDKELASIKPEGKERKVLKRASEDFCKQLRKKIKNKKIKADVFIGGSLAKNTIIKKKKYDVDIFVRFNKKYEDSEISKLLGKVIKGKKVHGSRDYFQVQKDKIVFEIVPSIKITKPAEARNVTDLSYFHVNYIINKIKKNKKLADEIMLGKSFCYAQDCYGAEGYIRGFSGYAVELLVSHCGSFLSFLKALSKKQKQIILDPKKFYKNKKEIMLELNESKLQSPIIFVDPTFKERNALAALSKETFQKFQKAAAAFLKNPADKFFEKKDLEKELSKHKDLIIIEAKSNRQRGDIAGSKLKKFQNYLLFRLKRDFDIKLSEFEYSEEKNLAKIYLLLHQKKEIIIPGPPITSIENLRKFKKKHKKSYIKKGRAYAKEKTLSFPKFLQKIKKDKTTKEMGIKIL